MQAPADQHSLAAHNVVAAFPGFDDARDVIEALKGAGFSESELSLLSRDGDLEAEAESYEEPQQLGQTMTGGAVKGGLAGLGVGGVAGLVAGALAFGIPGIGPAVGAGIWAATAGGAAAGATAGGLIGGFGRMWEAEYRDLVRDGKVLVGVHTAERDRADQAFSLLEGRKPVHLLHFDHDGAVIHKL